MYKHLFYSILEKNINLQTKFWFNPIKRFVDPPPPAPACVTKCTKKKKFKVI